MTKRRTVLSSIGAPLLLPGCVASLNSQGEEPSLSEQFECSDESRPECKIEETKEWEHNNRTYTSETTQDYPTQPESFDSDSVKSFIKKHEKAYLHNNTLCVSSDPQQITSIGVGINEVWEYDWYEDISIINLRYTKSFSGIDDSGPWVADGGPRISVYGIDETAVVRTEFDQNVNKYDKPEEENMPDPVAQGKLVTCFD